MKNKFRSQMYHLIGSFKYYAMKYCKIVSDHHFFIDEKEKIHLNKMKKKFKLILFISFYLNKYS